jgi:hypothetical protein
MKLHLLGPLVLDTRSWKVVEIQTWEANIWIFVHEKDAENKNRPEQFFGIVTGVLWFEELSQSDELQPHSSVEVEITGDTISIERRS